MLAGVLLSVVLCHCGVLAVVDPDQSEVDYLEKYGYLEPDDSGGIIETRSGADVRRALIQFQEFAGLDPTGRLDEKTRLLMKSARCGNKDKHMVANFVLSKGWEKQDLTYKILNYPSNKRLSDKEVDEAIERAFEAWREVSNLKFERRYSGPVDINLSFEKTEHGDGEYFAPGELGHAFPPQYGGDLHFADSENWTLDEYNGKNLLGIAMHELGHSLGLDHSKVKGSVMAPIYRGWDPFLRLSQDDIDGITALYG